MRNLKATEITELLEMAEDCIDDGLVDRPPKTSVITNNQEISDIVTEFFTAKLEARKAELRLRKSKARMDVVRDMLISLAHYGEVVVEFWGTDCDGFQWESRRHYKTLDDAHEGIKGEYDWADGRMSHTIII